MKVNIRHMEGSEMTICLDNFCPNTDVDAVIQRNLTSAAESDSELLDYQPGEREGRRSEVRDRKGLSAG